MAVDPEFAHISFMYIKSCDLMISFKCLSTLFATHWADFGFILDPFWETLYQFGSPWFGMKSPSLVWPKMMNTLGF